MSFKLLITGGNGFIGSSLLKDLVGDHSVRCYALVRESSDLQLLDDISESINIVKINCNITADDLCGIFNEIKPDAVIHLASLYITEHKTTDIENLVCSNIMFGAQLLEAMSRSGAKKLINVGTSWQHYNNNAYVPVNLYAATKQSFLDLAAYYVDALGLDVVDIKLYDTYGEKDKRKKLMAFLIENLGNKEPILLSPGEQKLNLLHVDDVISGLKASLNYIMQNELRGIEEYAIRSDNEFSIKEIVILIEELSGRKLKVEWGGRAYREREVMIPWSGGDCVPGWEQKIPLMDGVQLMLNKSRSENE